MKTGAPGRIGVVGLIGSRDGALDRVLEAMGPVDLLVSVGNTLAGPLEEERIRRAVRLVSEGALVLRGGGDPLMPGLFHSSRVLILGDAVFFGTNPLKPFKDHTIQGAADAAFYFPFLPGRVGIFGLPDAPAAWREGVDAPLPLGEVPLDGRLLISIGWNNDGGWGVLDLKAGVFRFPPGAGSSES